MTCLIALALPVALLTRCSLQPLDKSASSQTCVAPPPDSGSAGCFPILLDTPPINLWLDDAGEPGDTTGQACVKVEQDAFRALGKSCAGCHQGESSLQGAPLTFILDKGRLITSASPSPRFNGLRYVVPGDPDHSLLYQRAAITADMPPPGDATNPTSSLTVSDESVLREWITNCLGPSQAVPEPVDAGSGLDAGGGNDAGVGLDGGEDEDGGDP